MQRKRFINDLNVILLDMGNTFMFECDRFGQEVDYHSTYHSLGGNRLSPGSISLLINRLFEHMLEISRSPDYYDSYGTVEGYLRELLESAGLPASERKILESVFARHEVGRIPDSHVAILRELSHTHPLGVISNVWSHRGVFEEEFNRAGIEDLFEITIWSSDHGCIKPSPYLFRKALTHFNVEPERVAYVGDNPRRDVAGAKGVGMKAVWINSGNRELPVGIPQPDLTILDLGDLLDASVRHKVTIIKANGNRKKYLREEYISRINRVIDYIEKNVDKDLPLEKLAEVAYFSRFHFHRIFRAMVGETVNQFIQRIRVEKAASMLISNPKKSITEIAFDCGFSGSATFARAFRETFHMSASTWRSEGHLQDRKIRKTNSKKSQTVGKIRKDFDISSYYIDGETQNQIWRIKIKDKGHIQVEVRDIPELHVAYVRHIGPYKGNSELFENLFEKLMKWAGPRCLLRFPETNGLVVYHDDPNITDEDKLITSACITVPKDTPVEGEVGKMTIPGGKFAVGRFEITSDEFEEAWNTVMGGWLPESGYQPDDRLCYELPHTNYKEHPEKKHIVDICLPVKPL